MKILPMLFLSLVVAGQEYRFPKPEFSSGYQQPQMVNPMPQQMSEIFWVFMLIVVLVLSFFSLYRWRSRKIQLGLMLFSLLLFGFFRNGCVCSVGSFQNICASFFDSEFPLSLTVILFFGIPFLVSLVFGRLFCGSACPFGALQELLHFKSVKVPYVVDRLLRLLPIFYLAVAIVLASAQASFPVCEYDPYVAIFRFSGPFQIILFAALMLLVGIFISRPFCRYVCPYGVLLRWGSMFSSRRVSVTPGDCINCRLCEDACPNGAIIAPTDVKKQESVKLSVGRMKRLLVFSPGAIALGFLVGTRVGNWLAEIHPDVKLFRAVEFFSAGSTEANEMVTAFLASGTSMESLLQRATGAIDFMTRLSGIVGAFVVVALIVELILLLRKNEAEVYTVDMADCYCCSRCYDFCPVKAEKE